MMLDSVFAALADPTRRAILSQLAHGQRTVGELAKPFAISLPAISRHLRVLEAASLIRREREGQHRLCRLEPEGMKAVADWIEFYRRFWGVSLERLAEHLQHKKGQKGEHDG